MEPNQQDDFGGIAKFPIDKKSYGRQSVDYSKKENGFSLLEPSPSNSSAGVIPVRSMRLPPLQANPTPLSAMKLPPIQGTSSLVSTQMPLAPPIQPPPMMPPERIMSPPGQGQYERIVVKNSTITTEPPTPMGWKMSDPSATETKSFTQNTITKLTTYSALTTPATPLPAISEPAKKRRAFKNAQHRDLHTPNDRTMLSTLASLSVPPKSPNKMHIFSKEKYGAWFRIVSHSPNTIMPKI